MLSKLRIIVPFLGNDKQSQRINRMNRSFRTTFGCSNPKQIKEIPKKDHNDKIKVPSTFQVESSIELTNKNSQFMNVYLMIERELIDYTEELEETRVVAQHFEQALNYNVLNNSTFGASIAIIVYEKLIGQNNLTAENIRMGHILSWSIQMLQSTYMMSEHIVDSSQMRRQKVCWHALKIGESTAVNDIIMIKESVYMVLKKHFRHLTCYVNCLDLFEESTLLLTIGQSMDFLLSRGDVSNFTMDTYKSMTYNKFAHPYLYTPTAAAMLLAGYNDQKAFNEIKNICYELGHVVQVQRDLLDYIDNRDGSNGCDNDIVKGKCTWLAITAIECGSQQQKEVLQKFYGKNDIQCLEQIQRVYDELNFTSLYEQYKESVYNNTRNLIIAVDDDNLQRILFDVSHKIFNKPSVCFS